MHVAVHPRGVRGTGYPGSGALPVAPVHPRGCGEQHSRPSRTCPHFGSSPRVRGTATDTSRPSMVTRFIPAGAGNRTAMDVQTPEASVHPRGCGEQWCHHQGDVQAFGSSPAGAGNSGHGRWCDIYTPGSSPRVRGTVRNANSLRCAFRFIPAGAGNRAVQRARRQPRSVHPRGCGEQETDCLHVVHGAGSSPRVRGTARLAGAARDDPRFIPAGAGEQGSATGATTAPVGSSPRVRGTGDRLPPCGPWRRFIPAGAGNSTVGRRGPGRSPVHPRGCGEQRSIRCVADTRNGSSPRVRGTGSMQGIWFFRNRFIPAGAGNSIFIISTLLSTAVHPRGCGEQNSSRPRSLRYSGSSPRVRGTGAGWRAAGA